MINHVSLAFVNDKDGPLANFALGVKDGLTTNAVTFPSIPTTATLVMLGTAITTFNAKLVAAHKGSVAATAEKEVAREVLIGLLRILAAYVENVAQGDASKIEAAGFDVVTRGNNTQTPLTKPLIKAIRNLITTQLKVDVGAVRNAASFEVQIRIGSGAWQGAGSYPNSRSIVLEDLTPGTTYEVRVRAIGGSTKYSDWSDGVNHMCT